jgi:hypothetical protein
MAALGFNRWDMLPAANRGIRAASVSTNRRASDRYHSNTGIKNLLPGLPRPGRGRLARIARRSNNYNMPGHGVGGVPGNGVGGGIPSLHSLTGGLLKNHHAMTNPYTYTNTGVSAAGGGNVSPTKVKAMFTSAKPLPVRKIPNPPAVRQPKPMTTTRLGPLQPAATTRPSFARNSGN